jgi:transcriptional regulator with XRE-family HTH domain
MVVNTAKRRLRQHLKAQRQTHKALADQLGISQQYVSMLLKGTRRPSLVLAIRLERELGIPANEWAKAS